MSPFSHRWSVLHLVAGPVRVCVCAVGFEWDGLSRADDDGLLPAACVAQKAWSSSMGTQQHKKKTRHKSHKAKPPKCCAACAVYTKEALHR